MNLKQAIEIVESAGFNINDVENIELKMGYLTFKTGNLEIRTEECNGEQIKVINSNLEVNESLFAELINIKTLVSEKFDEINNIQYTPMEIDETKMTTADANKQLADGFTQMGKGMESTTIPQEPKKLKRTDFYNKVEWGQVPEVYKKPILEKIKTGEFIKIPLEDLINGAQTPPVINETPDVIEVSQAPVIDAQPLSIPPMDVPVKTVDVIDTNPINTGYVEPLGTPEGVTITPDVTPSTGTNLDELLGLNNA